MSSSRKWADLLNAEASHVVLQKGNRLQVIVRPTAKQLRRRCKGDWDIVAVGDEPDGGESAATSLPESLRAAALDALAGMFPEVGAKRDGKRRKNRDALSA